MSLKYLLTKNLLTRRVDDYIAKVVSARRYGLNDIIQRMLRRGTTATRADILAVIHLFIKVIKEIIEEGGMVHTDLFHTRFSIQGVFNGPDDAYDPKRHRLKLNLVAGKVLKALLTRIALEKTAPDQILPHILGFTDIVSERTNASITSGGVVEIIGSRLKIEGDHASNGVEFVAEDGTAHRVATLIDNKPTRLILIVPTLSPGAYTLRITTQHSGSNTLIASKVGEYIRPITVEVNSNL